MGGKVHRHVGGVGEARRGRRRRGRQFWRRRWRKLDEMEAYCTRARAWPLMFCLIVCRVITKQITNTSGGHLTAVVWHLNVRGRGRGSDLTPQSPQDALRFMRLQ